MTDQLYFLEELPGVGLLGWHWEAGVLEVTML